MIRPPKPSKTNPQVKVISTQHKKKYKELSPIELKVQKRRRKRVTLSILASTLLLLLLLAISFYIAKKTLRYEYNSATLTATVVAKRFPYDLIGSVDIPSSIMYRGKEYKVTAIDHGAFRDCKSLTSITIPNTVTSIGYNAFGECTSLSSIEIPNSVTTIGLGAFFGTPWEDAQPDGVIYINNVLYTYKGVMPQNTNITIKSGIVSIADYAFYGRSSLTSIKFPNSITNIGHSAFYDCTSLTSITIPNGVTKIGFSAFHGCTSLQSINISNSLTHVESEVFFGCKSLRSVTIPNSVTSIGYSAFYGCSSLPSITIPNSVTYIEEYAFYDCISLESITIPNSVKSIGAMAFFNTGFYNNYTNWREGALYINNCLISVNRLRSSVYTIPNGIRIIASGTFHDNTRLLAIKIPESMEFIENGELSSFSYIEVDKKNKKYDSREDCNAIIETETNTLISGCIHTKIPNNVVKIGYAAFCNCSSLKAIKIPNYVTTIENYAFANCSSLTSITLPRSITTIESWAFLKCESLSYVNIPKGIKRIAGNTFDRCVKLDTIYFEGSVKEWKSISKICKGENHINKVDIGFVPPTEFTIRMVQCTNGTTEF